VLWRCWLGGRKGIRPVKNEWWGTGVVICLEQGAFFHMAQLMPLPLTVSCFSKIQIGFTFLVPAHLGSPGQRAVKRVCVYVYFTYSDGCALWLLIGRRWQGCLSDLPVLSSQPARSCLRPVTLDALRQRHHGGTCLPRQCCACIIAWHSMIVLHLPSYFTD